MLYNLLGPGISFYRKSKINIKRKPNNGFLIDQCPFHIDCMPFTLQTMILCYNYKSSDVFYSPNSSLFNSFKKSEIEMDSLRNILY